MFLQPFHLLLKYKCVHGASVVAARRLFRRFRRRSSRFLPPFAGSPASPASLRASLLSAPPTTKDEHVSTLNSVFTDHHHHSTATMPKGAGLTKPMKLSPELAAIVGKKEASRAECVKQLWAYIKKHNLQDPENRQFFIPDKTMAKVFGSDRLRAFSMSKHIGAHLS